MPLKKLPLIQSDDSFVIGRWHLPDPIPSNAPLLCLTFHRGMQPDTVFAYAIDRLWEERGGLLRLFHDGMLVSCER
jgi:hypothetical protein